MTTLRVKPLGPEEKKLITNALELSNAQMNGMIGILETNDSSLFEKIKNSFSDIFTSIKSLFTKQEEENNTNIITQKPAHKFKANQTNKPNSRNKNPENKKKLQEAARLLLEGQGLTAKTSAIQPSQPLEEVSLGSKKDTINTTTPFSNKREAIENNLKNNPDSDNKRGLSL